MELQIVFDTPFRRVPHAGAGRLDEETGKSSMPRAVVPLASSCCSSVATKIGWEIAA